MKEFLERAGFEDIIENLDGTFDATINSVRYKGLYVSNIISEFEDDSIVSIPCRIEPLSPID